MNRLRNILVLAVALVAFWGCKNDTQLVNEEETTSSPKNGYIFFDTAIESRGALVFDDYLTKDFNVIGYKSNEKWETVKVQATQNSIGVFQTKPQLVTYSNNAHSYTNPKQWENYYYAFFAWYPIDIYYSGDSHIGNPYITYTLDRTNSTNHKDVMTACYTDIKPGPGVSKTVTFEMRHRLSALDIIARSYVNNTTLGISDDAIDTKVLIKDVDIQLENLIYDKATIPLNTLDDNEKIIGENESSKTNGSFGDFAVGQTISYYQSSENDVNVTGDNDKTMILIPQEDNVICTVTVTYDIVDVNNENSSIWDSVYKDTPQEDIPDKRQEISTTIKSLNEGTYYRLMLNFTKSGITLVVLEANDWEDEYIEHEFD